MKNILKVLLIILFGLLLYIVGSYIALSNKVSITPNIQFTRPLENEVGEGTGYFINQTQIVTDAHVTEISPNLKIISQEDGSIKNGRVAFVDKENDLAIINVEGGKSINQEILCISSKSLNYGDFLSSFGYGNAYGNSFNPLYHKGFVSSSINPGASLLIKGGAIMVDGLNILPGDSGSPVMFNRCIIGNVHFAPVVENSIVFGTAGITMPGVLENFLKRNNIDYITSPTFTNYFESDIQRFKKSVVRIAIIMTPEELLNYQLKQISKILGK